MGCMRMINRKKLLFSFSIILSLFLVLGIIQIKKSSDNFLASSHKIERPEIKVIIDPGHGGVDGGAVASDGTSEKDINLQIALILNEMLKMSGGKTIMTRCEDISIHDDSAKTIRAKKVSDIHNRFKIIEENSDFLFVSIHQNIYANSNINGAQVFYSPNSESSIELARKIQNSFFERLQKNNDREIKKCTTDVYLIYHAKSTAVLCECGFLSNKEELQKLKSAEYKKQVAFCIYLGILDYYSSLD